MARIEAAPPEDRKRRAGVALFRLTLGLTQMTSAAVAVIHILFEGLSDRAVAYALLATCLTALSRLLFRPALES